MTDAAVPADGHVPCEPADSNGYASGWCGKCNRACDREFYYCWCCPVPRRSGQVAVPAPVPAAGPPPRKPVRTVPDGPHDDIDAYLAWLQRERTIARLDMLAALIVTLARRTGRTRTI